MGSMEERKEPVLPSNSNPKESTFCEECKSNPSKYKCPGCSIRSCSLQCVKAHKQRTGCTGKRNQTQFVPLSQFDDKQLLSDYNMLEEVKRVAESAQRMRYNLCRYNYFRLPYHLRSLRNAASSRRTKLLFLPSGMSKREKNQTRYDQRKKSIYWTIEWQFHSADVVLLDHGVNENMNLCSAIGNHLKPGPWNHPLRKFCEEQLDHLKFFICKYPKGSKSPFYELDSTIPIRQQFANLVILEYPVIYVFLPSQSCDFEVIRDANPIIRKPHLRNSKSNDHLTKEGTAFKEEEIEDNSSLEPKVFDFMKYGNPDSLHQFPHQGSSEKLLSNLSDRASSAKEVAGNSPQSSLKTKEQGLFEDMEFDFDQGLIDVYSDLISQINPDDFLDLEGEFSKEEEVEGKKNPSYLMEDFPADNDLEEGEILE
ncbi:uncharacterized protein LOC107405507 [Ziziphus jujuba]|uniref:Box C/D snoRNA protein 1 n=1 Tax=Ziziphus jujuba TaxID=326968 RepID=A0A6P3Z1Q4_ZIZJJ|nr:uncharacterized protein LOC107405507 [Ziziphus jujuba]